MIESDPQFQIKSIKILIFARIYTGTIRIYLVSTMAT